MKNTAIPEIPVSDTPPASISHAQDIDETAVTLSSPTDSTLPTFVTPVNVTRKILRPITCRWHKAILVFRCKECRRNIYPGHMVRFEGPDTYCYRCGSAREDDLKRRIRENTIPLKVSYPEHEVTDFKSIHKQPHGKGCARLPGIGSDK